MQKHKTKPKTSNKTTKKTKKSNKIRLLKYFFIFLLVSVTSLVFYVGYVYAVSPTVIRNPKLEHYHFRMQILVNGKAENFSEDRYQQDYSKDQCNANLTEQPIHFHDNKNQFTHIHWEGMTGGMVMKYYGWNFIGGIKNALGYKLDNLGDIQKVNTHGNFLPEIPEGSNFYIYIGDESQYLEKSFEDWKNQDLEKFFDKTSNFPAHEQNKQSRIINTLFPKVYSHGTADDADGDDGDSPPNVIPSPAPPPEFGPEQLLRINNLIGNVVIFVQKDKPTDQQITERFNSLIPSSESTCGG